VPKSGAGPGGLELPPQVGVVVQLGGHPSSPGAGVIEVAVPASG
jgi:hypothetical protein